MSPSRGWISKKADNGRKKEALARVAIRLAARLEKIQQMGTWVKGEVKESFRLATTTEHWYSVRTEMVTGPC
jgi:hypothetical protein